MPDWFQRWLGSLQELSWWEILLYTVVGAFLAQFVLPGIVRLVTLRTKTRIDDVAVATLRRPIFLSVIALGLAALLRGATRVDWFPGGPQGYAAMVRVLLPLMTSIVIFAWMRALMRIADAVLEVLARRVDDFRWIEPRSLPLYEIGAKLALVGSAAYALFLTWDIDVTAWLASAGILGIAIGFAAKDTLANLFAGMFILADAPYKLGDYILLESGERGMVTDIGIRSTRVLTRDDIEITVPNGVMANSKIVNESSGPHVKRRLRVDVGIAYGSDVEAAKAVMLEAARGCDLLSDEPRPTVRFRAFGASSLDFQVRGYIEQPVLHGRAVDQVCTRLYQALNEAGIEIPFPQRVVHVVGGNPAS